MFYYLYFMLFLTVVVYIITERTKELSFAPSSDNGILIEHVPEAYQEMIALIEASKESGKFSKNSTTIDLGYSTSTTTTANPQKMNEAFVNPQKHKKYNVPLLSLLLGRRNDTDQSALATLVPCLDRLIVDASTETSKGIRKHSKSEHCFKAKGYPLSPMGKVSVGEEMTINQELQSNLSGDIQSQHQVNHEFGKNSTLIAPGEMKVHVQIDSEEEFMHDKQITTKKNVQINEQHGNAGTGFVVNKAESMLVSNNQVIDKAETYFTNDVVINGYDFGDKDLDLRMTTRVADFLHAKPTTPEAFSGYGVTDLMTIMRKAGNGEDKFITAEKEHGNAGGGFMSIKQVVVNTGTGSNIN